MNPLLEVESDAGVGGLLAGLLGRQVLDRRNPFNAVAPRSARAQGLFADHRLGLRYGGQDEYGLFPSDYRFDNLRRMRGEIMGQGQGPMIYPGLSMGIEDKQLRQDVEDALRGRRE